MSQSGIRIARAVQQNIPAILSFLCSKTVTVS